MAVYKPFQIPPEKLLAYPPFSKGTHLHIGGIWGDVRAGDSWKTGDGLRFVLCADSSNVYFVKDGVLWGQRAEGFIEDVRFAHAPQVVRSTQGMAIFIEAEMNFIMGIVAGLSGAGFALVAGAGIAEFVTKTRAELPKWYKAIATLLGEWDTLKRYAPKTYDRILAPTVYAFLKQVAKELPAAVASSPTLIGKCAGMILGGILSTAVRARRGIVAVGGLATTPVTYALDAHKAILTVLSKIVTQSAKALPRAAGRAAHDFSDLYGLSGVFTKLGLDLDKRDLVEIGEELVRNREALRSSFKRIQLAFDQI
jgi:hypothetical protein